MSYLLPLVLAIGLSTADKLASRHTLRRHGYPDGYLLVYQLICLSISLPPAVLALSGAGGASDPAELRVPDARLWVLAALAVAAWSIYGISTFRSAARLDLSVSAMIGSSKLVWTALLGILVFGESLSALHAAGLAAVFLANVLLRLAPLDQPSADGVAYALVAAISLSAAIALDKLLLDYLDPSVVLCLGFAGSALTSLVLNRRSSPGSLRRVVPGAAVAALAGSAGYLCLLLAMRTGDLSVVVPVYQSSHVVYVLAGIVLLHERTAVRQKAIAVSVSVIGVALIFSGS